MDAAAGMGDVPPATSPGGRELVMSVRALSRHAAKAPRFAYHFEDAAMQFGGRLVIAADPRQLARQFLYEIDLGSGKLDPSRFFLGSGDWSSLLHPVQRSPIYLQAQQIKNADFAFRRTGMYQRLRTAIAEGRFPMLNHVEIDTVEKLDAYYRNYRDMIVRAGKHGISRRPAVKLDGDPARYRVSGARPLWAELSERDVGVAIDRDGQLCRIGPGKHRTAAAKIMGLERMPCEVRMVHVEWLRSRVPDLRNPGQIIKAIRSLALPPRSPESVP